jgi:hypothetical protein
MAKSFSDPSPSSMREQATDRTFRQQVAGDLAVCPFPQSRAAVAAGDDQADVFVRDERSNEFAADLCTKPAWDLNFRRPRPASSAKVEPGAF